MRIEIEGTLVRIDGQQVPRNPVLPPDEYDALLLGAESVGGVDGGTLGARNAPCCVYGIACFVDGLKLYYDHNVTPVQAPVLTALANTGIGFLDFDDAIADVASARGLSPTVGRVPLLDVFERVGIVRGAR